MPISRALYASCLSLLCLFALGASASPSNIADLDWNTTFLSSSIRWRYCKLIGKGHWWHGGKKNDCDGEYYAIERYGAVMVGIYCPEYCKGDIKGAWREASHGPVIYEQEKSFEVLGGRVQVLVFQAPVRDAKILRVTLIRDRSGGKYNSVYQDN